MNSILLTDEEIRIGCNLWIASEPNRTLYDYYHAVAKTQLKKVRSKIAVVEIVKDWVGAGYNVDGKPYIALAMLKEDWEALDKECE